MSRPTRATRPTRRQLLAGGAAGAAGVAVGSGGTLLATRDAGSPGPVEPTPTPAPAADGRGTPVPAAGTTQAGVDRPGTPPHHLVLAVLRAPRDLGPGRAGALLRTLGQEVLALTDPDGDRLPDPAGNLTVQVGIGADWVALADRALAERVRLASFAGSDDLPDHHRGGDLVLSAAADDAGLPDHVPELLLATLPGFTVQSAQRAFRSPGTGTVVRNPLGYLDGIVQPAGAPGTQPPVWIGDGPGADGSVGVVRRFTLDATGFSALPTEEQDAVMGRRADGTPLSGGEPTDDVDLVRKTPDGQYLTPDGSHARAAHPSFTGSALMARRSYAYRDLRPDGTSGPGLLFLSFQSDVAAFNKTQLRMDREDRLMDFATPTAEASFLVLPGFDTDRPLGATLFG